MGGVASSESPRPNGPDPHLSDYTPAIEFALAVTVALYIAVHLAGVLTRGRSRRTREVFQAVTGIGVGMAALVVVALLLANKPGQTAAALGVASPGAAPQAVPWPPDSASSDGSSATGLTPEFAKLLQNAVTAVTKSGVDLPPAPPDPAAGGAQQGHPGSGHSVPPTVTSPAPPVSHTPPPTTHTPPPTTTPPTTDPPTTDPPTTDPPTTDPPTTDPPTPTDPPSSP